MATSPFPSKGWRVTRNDYEWIEPVSYPWYWFRINQWFGQTAKTLWFTLRLPAFRYPYLSWNTSWSHGYIGFKLYGMRPTNKDAEYEVWLPKDIVERQKFTEAEMNAVTLTARFGLGPLKG